MISTTSLSKAYGGRVLFEDVSLQLNPGNRYGLVGANGSGKCHRPEAGQVGCLLEVHLDVVQRIGDLVQTV